MTAFGKARAQSRESRIDPLENALACQAPPVGGPVPGASSTTPIIAVSADAHVDPCAATRVDGGGLPRDAAGRTRSVADTGAHVGAPDARPRAIAGAEIKIVSKLDAAILCTQARAALTGLGWKPAIAHAAVDAAVAAKGAEMTLERLIFESLRRCPAPRA